MKRITGFAVILLFVIVDFFLVQDLLLESNSMPIVAVLGSILLCAGLEGGPLLLGMGIIEINDKTRRKSGSGNLKCKIFILVGGICTAIAFAAYFIIRRDAILEKGGFSIPHYEGYNGDLILMTVPFITSLLAFGVSLWIYSYGLDDAEKYFAKVQKEYNAMLNDRIGKLANLKDVLSSAWQIRFPALPINENVAEAIETIKGSILAEFKSRLNILLPQLITETNITTPFISVFIETYKNHVHDPDYLSSVKIELFDSDTDIGKAYDELQKNINNSSESIIQHIFS